LQKFTIQHSLQLGQVWLFNAGHTRFVSRTIPDEHADSSPGLPPDPDFNPNYYLPDILFLFFDKKDYISSAIKREIDFF